MEKLRKEVDSDASYTIVLRGRHTKKGNLLIRIGDPASQILKDKISRIVIEMGNVRRVDRKVTLEGVVATDAEKKDRLKS